MSDAYCTADGCGYPCHDQAYICQKHTDALAVELAKVAKIADEFDVVLSRQTNTRGLDRGPGSSEQPLPYDDRASETRWLLQATITTWARSVSEERGLDIPSAPPPPSGALCAGSSYCVVHESCKAIRGAETPTADALAAAFLADNLKWLRHQQYADQAVDELTAAIRAAEQIVDLKAERLYLGRCGAAAGDSADCSCHCHVGGLDAECSIDGGCGLEFHVAATGSRCDADLYAKPGRAIATCKGCGTRYDVADRQAYVLKAADDHRDTAKAISALCRHMLGKDVSTAMIRGYARRGRITARGTLVDTRGKTVPAYRVGDVVNAVLATRKSPELQRDARQAAREELAADAAAREGARELERVS